MEFITKMANGIGRQGYDRYEDVLISVNKNGKSKTGMNLTVSFSEKAKKMVFGDADYAVMAFSDDGKQLFFKTSDKKYGYKLSRQKGASTRILKISINNKLLKESVRNWSGYYSVEFSTEQKLWFVSIEKKII